MFVAMLACDQFPGFLIAALVGVSLGLTGGGGSILTIPSMVYLLGIEPLLATSYSLFVVGVSSLAGSLSNMYKGLVNYRAAVVYALPSMASVFLTRKFLLPLIPDTIVAGRLLLGKGETIMMLLAFVMIVAAFSMIRSGSRDAEETLTPEAGNVIVFNYPLILAEGLIVGTITGFLGAGGGFLIIPVLVLVSHIPMRVAIGTSLLIISINSLAGFGGDLGQQSFEWPFLARFTLTAVAGVLAGAWMGRRIPASRLKKIFGWFVFSMACFILYREILAR